METYSSIPTELTGAFGEKSSYTPERVERHHAYFERLIEELNLYKVDGDMVAVLHILPDAIPFTKALGRIADFKAIVPKPKSKDKKIIEELLEQQLPIREIGGRTDVESVIGPLERPTAFLDIGGYFSICGQQIRQRAGENLYGIVEDTENGLQKYLRHGVDFPFFSVARSPLKDHEDKKVGQAIAHSAETLLRGFGVLVGGREVGVIGYGKVGGSLADAMHSKQGKVTVHDKNNLRQLGAASDGFGVGDKYDILRESDIIGLATGNGSLSGEDFKHVKNGSWIFSVTSSDDELGKQWLEDNYHAQRLDHYATRYTRGGHYFYLLNEGNAINFIHGTTVGDYILPVHSEILVATHRLLTGQFEMGNYDIDIETRNKIAGIWLSHFKMNRDSF